MISRISMYTLKLSNLYTQQIKLILTIFFSPVRPLHHGTILHPEWMGEYLNVVNESSRLIEWSHRHRLGSGKKSEMSNCQVSISFCLKYLEYLQN